MRPTWEGRPVELREFTIAEGKPIEEAFRVDRDTGMLTLLCISARYADDGSPVFADVAAIQALPYRLTAKLWALAAQAAEVNTVEQVEEPGGAAAGPPA